MIKTHGYKSILSPVKDKDSHWCFRISGKPKHDVDYCYLVAGNRYRVRAKIYGFYPGPEFRWSEIGFDGSEQEKPYLGKHFMVLHDYEPLPANARKRRVGFQGFRYLSLDEETKLLS